MKALFDIFKEDNEYKIVIACAKLVGSVEGLIAFIEDNINNEDFKPELLKRVNMIKTILE